jgi:hypothetical protein
MSEAIDTGPPSGPSKTYNIEKGAEGPPKKRPRIKSDSETSEASEEHETHKIITRSQERGTEICKTNDEDREKCDKRPKMDSNPPSTLEVTRMQTEEAPNTPNDSELSGMSSSPPLIQNHATS